jgi:chromosome segregation and condensation protein ScpB
MSLSPAQQQVLAIVRAEQPVTLDAIKRWSLSSSPRGGHGMTQALNALVRRGFVETVPGSCPVLYRPVGRR